MPLPKFDSSHFTSANLAAAETVLLAAQRFNPLEQFKSSILDQTFDYPPPPAIVTLRQVDTNIPLLTSKSLSLWQGKAKARKTTLLAMAVAAFISSESSANDICFQCQMQGTVIFFDTEQGESYAARTMRLILKLADLKTSDRLIYCDLRQYPPTQRMEIIEAGIKNTPTVKIAVIDGFVDLLTDFMSAAEGHACVTELVKWCSEYDIHIAGVLHQNKGDKNARAHIGTITSQKCEIEISTEVDPNDKSRSVVKCVNSRGIPFEDFSIRWDKGCLPKIEQRLNKSRLVEIQDATKSNELFKLCQYVFEGNNELTYSQVLEKIVKSINKSADTAKRRLKAFVDNDWVCKKPDGKYCLNIKETCDEGAKGK